MVAVTTDAIHIYLQPQIGSKHTVAAFRCSLGLLEEIRHSCRRNLFSYGLKISQYKVIHMLKYLFLAFKYPQQLFPSSLG